MHKAKKFLVALLTLSIIVITLHTLPKNETPAIICESADILHYPGGSPYIHDVLTNHTDKTITAAEYALLAYDDNGAPLALHWHYLDSSAPHSYDHLVCMDDLSLAPAQTKDTPGGWSLANDEAEEVAYTLLCLKQVTFDDGTIWHNADYDAWCDTYAGQIVAVNDLQNYYPHNYPIVFERL